jgi:hypothetical protein
MQWLGYIPFLAIPLVLLVIAVCRLRIDAALAGQFRFAILLYVVSAALSSTTVLFDTPRGAVGVVFLSSLANLLAWLVLVFACLRLAWINQPPDNSPAETEEGPIERGS